MTETERASVSLALRIKLFESVGELIQLHVCTENLIRID